MKLPALILIALTVLLTASAFAKSDLEMTSDKSKGIASIESCDRVQGQDLLDCLKCFNGTEEPVHYDPRKQKCREGRIDGGDTF